MTCHHCSPVKDRLGNSLIPHSVRNSLLLWVARLDDGAELKMTDPKEQQRDIEEKEAKGEERWDGVDGGRRGMSC